MGGSSKKQTVGYKYFMGLFVALCHSPVDRVHKQTAGERDAWVGPVDDDATIEIDKPDLFGGDKREGGLKGRAEIMMGKATQTLSSWARSLLPEPHVGYRGVLTVLYDGLVAANSPYMKAWAWRVERVLKGWQDDDCWYPAKAPIALEEAFEQAIGTYNVSWASLSSGAPGYPSPGSLHPQIVTLGPWRSDVQLRVGDAAGVGTLGCDDYLQINGTTVNPLGLPAAATMPGGTVLGTFAAGTPVVMRVLNSIHPRSGGEGVVTAFRVVPGARAMNPAHIIVQCLTDTEWGDGWPRAMIGPSFTSAADTLHAEGFGLCLLWSRQGEIWDFITEVCSHIGGVVYQDPRTGLFELKLLRADYDAAGLPLIESTPDMVESFQRATYGAMVNEVTVIYRDWKTNTDAGVTVQNGACIAAQGGTVAETKQYPGIPTAELAARVAQRDVIASSTPLARATILCDRSAWAMTPGSVFRWRFLQEGLDGVVMRVLDVDRGELADGVIKLVIAEDVFGLPSASYIGTEPPAWEQPDGAAAPPMRQQLVELPYRSLVSELSAVELAALDDDVAFFGALAARPSSVSLGVELWSRSDGATSYSDQGPGAFVPAAELADAVDRLTDILTLVAGVDLDDIEADEYAVIGTGRGAEWVQVVSLDLNTSTATVRRGVLDTVPQAWPAGTPVWFDAARSAADPTERATGETIGVKLLTYTSSSTLSLDDGIEISATADQRQARPYPPADVRFNGEYWPALAETPVTLTWAHRDRTQQTAPAAQAWTDGSIGPETGVTYSLTVRDAATNGLLYSADGLTGTSTEISVGSSAEVIVTLSSVRDGLDCWQPFEHSVVLADGVLAAESGDVLAAGDAALLVADVVGDSVIKAVPFAVFGGRIYASPAVIGPGGAMYVSDDGGATYIAIASSSTATRMHYQSVPASITSERFARSPTQPLAFGVQMSTGEYVSIGLGLRYTAYAPLERFMAQQAVCDLPGLLGVVPTVSGVDGTSGNALTDGMPRTGAAHGHVGVMAIGHDAADVVYLVGMYSDPALWRTPSSSYFDPLDVHLFRRGAGGELIDLGSITQDPSDPSPSVGDSNPVRWASFLAYGAGRLRLIGGRWWLVFPRGAYYNDDIEHLAGWRRAQLHMGEDGGFVWVTDIVAAGSALYAIAAMNSATQATGWVGLSRSIDGGATWTPLYSTASTVGYPWAAAALGDHLVLPMGVGNRQTAIIGASDSAWTLHPAPAALGLERICMVQQVGGGLCGMTSGGALCWSVDGINWAYSSPASE